MANNFKRSNEAANAEANTIGHLLDSGYLRIYGGEQPADADTAPTTQTLIATLTFGSTAFSTASSGVITASSITSDTSADATTGATWFLCVKSDDTSYVLQGSVGSTDADLILNSTAIQSGAEVAVTSFTYTASKTS